MKQISCNNGFQKAVFPGLFAVLSGAFLFVALRFTGWIGDWGPLILNLVSAAIAILGGVLLYRHVRADLGQYMDEVFDAGNFLLVRNAGEQESLPLKSIEEVTYRIWRPSEVRLILSEPCKFGAELAFYPDAYSLQYPAFAKALTMRIEKARGAK